LANPNKQARVRHAQPEALQENVRFQVDILEVAIMENKKFLSQANELGPNCGKAIRTETGRKNLGVYLSEDAGIGDMFILGTSVVSMILVILLWWLA
jgi:hypothetical protein